MYIAAARHVHTRMMYAHGCRCTQYCIHVHECVYRSALLLTVSHIFVHECAHGHTCSCPWCAAWTGVFQDESTCVCCTSVCVYRLKNTYTRTWQVFTSTFVLCACLPMGDVNQPIDTVSISRVVIRMCTWAVCLVLYRVHGHAHSNLVAGHVQTPLWMYMHRCPDS